MTPAETELKSVVILELRQQTELAAQSELEALEGMLEQTPSSVPRLREQIAKLESLRAA